jgi:hypothetical protein
MIKPPDNQDNSEERASRSNTVIRFRAVPDTSRVLDTSPDKFNEGGFNVRKLDDQYLRQLALGGESTKPAEKHREGGETARPHVRYYRHLGDAYSFPAEANKLSLDHPGVRSWSDAFELIRRSWINRSEPQLEFVFRQFEMTWMDAPDAFLEQIKTLSRERPERSITLVVKGQSIEPARVEIIKNGEILSHREARNFWMEGEFAACSLSSLSEEGREQDLNLYSALSYVHRREPYTNLGDFLSKVITRLNDRYPQSGVSLNKRTEIFSRLEGLKWRLRRDFVRYSRAHPEIAPPEGAFYEDLVTQILRAHPINRSFGNAWHSIGAGQMVALLEYPRRLMDEGYLPLDFRLKADNRSFEAIAEINDYGTRVEVLKGRKINTPDRALIEVHPQEQRKQVIEKEKPKVILLNPKTKELVKLVTSQEFVSWIGALSTVPALVMPSKAFERHGDMIIPYPIIYGALQSVSQELADALIVAGGFFAAPEILSGELTEMTFSGASLKYLEYVREGFSATPMDPVHRRADWAGVSNLKFIESASLATFLQAGGALKNIVTYYQARQLLGRVMQSPPANVVEENQLEKILLQAKEDNIDLVEEVVARIAPKHGVSTLHLWAPEGLKRDIESCLPKNLEGIYQIMARFSAMDRSRDLNHLPRFLEDIRNGLGGGTRNARDGFIDEVLCRWYDQAKTNSDFITSFPTYSDFYKTYYPNEWKGDNGMEGRKGIAPLINWAEDFGVNLPPQMYQAWNLYFPEQEKEAVVALTRPFHVEDGDVLDGIWGFGKSSLKDLRTVLFKLSQNLADPDRDLEASQGFFLGGIEKMLIPMDAMIAKAGMYPEVTDRIDAIRRILLDLQQRFKENHIGEQEKLKARANFEEAVNQTLQVLRFQPVDTNSLLNHLRLVAQKLHAVTLAIDKSLRRRYGLARPGDTLNGNGHAKAPEAAVNQFSMSLPEVAMGSWKLKRVLSGQVPTRATNIHLTRGRDLVWKSMSARGATQALWRGRFR